MRIAAVAGYFLNRIRLLEKQVPEPPGVVRATGETTPYPDDGHFRGLVFHWRPFTPVLNRRVQPPNSRGLMR